MKNGLEPFYRFFFVLLVSILIGKCMCSCSGEREVQAKLSTGTVTKIDTAGNRLVVKVRDNNDWVVYADYFDLMPYPPTVGQVIWIIVRR